MSAYPAFSDYKHDGHDRGIADERAALVRVLANFHIIKCIADHNVVSKALIDVSSQAVSSHKDCSEEHLDPAPQGV
jgi:hypothetical protein